METRSVSEGSRSVLHGAVIEAQRTSRASVSRLGGRVIEARRASEAKTAGIFNANVRSGIADGGRNGRGWPAASGDRPGCLPAGDGRLAPAVRPGQSRGPGRQRQRADGDDRFCLGRRTAETVAGGRRTKAGEVGRKKDLPPDGSYFHFGNNSLRLAACPSSINLGVPLNRRLTRIEGPWYDFSLRTSTWTS